MPLSVSLSKIMDEKGWIYRTLLNNKINKNRTMEDKKANYEMPQVKFVAIEVEQGFAVSDGPEQYTYAGGEVF